MNACMHICICDYKYRESLSSESTAMELAVKSQ